MCICVHLSLRISDMKKSNFHNTIVSPSIYKNIYLFYNNTLYALGTVHVNNIVLAKSQPLKTRYMFSLKNTSPFLEAGYCICNNHIRDDISFHMIGEPFL